MDPIQPEVKTETQPASTEQKGVETKPTLAPEEDPEVIIAALLAENKRVTSDRDNYRKATLALKGKTETEDLDLSDPSQLAAYIQRQVDDRMSASSEAVHQKTLESTILQQARDLKEAKLALKNRSAMVPAGMGSGGTPPEPTSQYFSEAQVADLKKRGFDDVKIKALEARLKAKG